jgi:L-asparaginase/Glu-tRNA(Gln) amidotransferase subunit D
MEDKINILHISPCINIEVINLVIEKSKAVIIRAYGMGNIPSKDEEFLKSLYNGVKQGKVIIVLT